MVDASFAVCELLYTKRNCLTDIFSGWFADSTNCTDFTLSSVVGFLLSGSTELQSSSVQRHTRLFKWTSTSQLRLFLTVCLHCVMFRSVAFHALALQKSKREKHVTLRTMPLLPSRGAMLLLRTRFSVSSNVIINTKCVPLSWLESATEGRAQVPVFLSRSQWAAGGFLHLHQYSPSNYANLFIPLLSPW